MKRTVLVASLLLFPAPAAPQQMLDSVPAAFRVPAPRNPGSAAALEMLLPFAGYAYAGNAGKGIMPGLLSLGGAALFISGAAAAADAAADCAADAFGAVLSIWIVGISGEGEIAQPTCEDRGDGAMVGGMAIYVASRIWGAAGAHRTARNGNATLRERLGGATLRTGVAGTVEGARWTMGIALPW